MAQIEIYTKGYCPHCKAAKQTLTAKGLTFREFDVTDDDELLNEMLRRSERKTVPQIFVGKVHIGGNQDLMDAIKAGEFERVLQAQGIKRRS
ncbi:glutaredoxin 3 [Shewanella sp. JM162201]|uniref:Glutaredoxin n=1 Tax=Shewanella jiangmenensis TaxID=2837387 RepID=A0ABS5V5Y8_9GAMM|nr:glutaredoxin 3 [Shewanella jiangmenensis]MBT1445388.1 glutaredoxin 3 [Shewanella jiangmenensis]